MKTKINSTESRDIEIIVDDEYQKGLKNATDNLRHHIGIDDLRKNMRVLMDVYLLSDHDSQIGDKQEIYDSFYLLDLFLKEIEELRKKPTVV